MLKLKNGKIVNGPVGSRYEAEIAATSDELLPSGAPIGSSIFVADKVDVVFCDGRNNWYRSVNGMVRSASAGQRISALF